MRLHTVWFVAAAALFGSSAALADNIEAFTFSFTDPSAGNLAATGILNVDLTTSQALSGSGSINSSLFVGSNGVTPLGTQSMSLVTSSNRGQNNVDSLGGFLWTDSDGTNLTADTNFTATAPHVDSDGLLFQVGAPTINGHYASFNFWYENGALYGDFLGNGGPPGMGQVWNISTTGTFSVTPVPLPAAAWMLVSGLTGLGTLVGRRKTNLL
jgi:hypothetical protein